MDLIADVGATNSRCALLADDGSSVRSANFLNANFAGLGQLLSHFLGQDGRPARVRRAALAIAAPISGDTIAMTNIGWRFARSELAAEIGVSELSLLNDFEALAHALPALGPAHCVRVGGGQAIADANMAVIGPGSGLGVAASVRGADGWIAVAGEGGHVSVPAFDATEAALLEDHGDANGHCSAERLLSGPGLVRIHSTLTRLAGEQAESITPAAVTARAASGDVIARQCFDVFFAVLGSVAGNLALTVGARGGVYIAGGIVPRVLDAFGQSRFRERFVAKGRYRDYLDAIPTAVITVEQPAFIGLRSLLGHR